MSGLLNMLLLLSSLLSLGLAQDSCNCSAGLEDLQVIQDNVMKLKDDLEAVAALIQCPGELIALCVCVCVCVCVRHLKLCSIVRSV